MIKRLSLWAGNLRRARLLAVGPFSGVPARQFWEDLAAFVAVAIFLCVLALIEVSPL